MSKAPDGRLPCGPVVRTLRFHRQGLGFHPSSGELSPHKLLSSVKIRNHRWRWWDAPGPKWSPCLSPHHRALLSKEERAELPHERCSSIGLEEGEGPVLVWGRFPLSSALARPAQHWNSHNSCHVTRSVPDGTVCGTRLFSGKLCLGGEEPGSPGSEVGQFASPPKTAVESQGLLGKSPGHWGQCGDSLVPWRRCHP